MVIVAGQRLCCALKQIIFGPSNTLVNILRQIWSPKKVNFQNFAVGCQVNVNFDILYLKMIFKKKIVNSTDDRLHFTNFSFEII